MEAGDDCGDEDVAMVQNSQILPVVPYCYHTYCYDVGCVDLHREVVATRYLTDVVVAKADLVYLSNKPLPLLLQQQPLMISCHHYCDCCHLLRSDLLQ